MSAKKLLKTGCSLVVLVLLAVPATAATIGNGIDLWHTPEGFSSTDFSENPIPAGFFCAHSRPFRGQIVWKGLSIATSPPDALGDADTIIQRLDDAVFDRDGVATTRLQVAALSLASVAPIRSRGCGRFDVTATLTPGEQPTTVMRIVREGENGGYFEAPLALNVRLTFTSVRRGHRLRLELDHAVEFPPAANAAWTDTRGDDTPLRSSVSPGAGTSLELRGFVLYDSDSDGVADTFLPGTSNFFPTMGFDPTSPDLELKLQACSTGCHCVDTTTHCVSSAS